MVALDNNAWNKLCKSFPHCEDMPFGYLSINAFCERCGVSNQTVRVAVLGGKRIKHNQCITVPNGTGLTVGINWNEAAYNFITEMPPHKRPPDFVQSKRREYRPIKADIKTFHPKNGIIEPLDESAEDDGSVHPQNIFDIGTAKLELEKLKVEKMRAEVDQAKGLLLSVKDVKAANREIVFQLKAALLVMVNSIAPTLVGRTSISDCRLILLKGLNEALENLRGLDGPTKNECLLPTSTDD